MQSRLTALMIAQAYLSTVIMFASLYVITYRINVSKSSCSYFIVYVYAKRCRHRKWYDADLIIFRVPKKAGVGVLEYSCLRRTLKDNSLCIEDKTYHSGCKFFPVHKCANVHVYVYHIIIKT